MKNLIVLFVALSLLSCKKEPVYGPLNLKDGQEVELLVDHHYAADRDPLVKLPENINAGSSLSGFLERQAGYSYHVIATFRVNDPGLQDAPAYYYEFKKVISAEKYNGNESFTVQLIIAPVPGGPYIRLNKQGNDYYLIPDKLQLTYADTAVQTQLEEIWQNVQAIRANPTSTRPNWSRIKATVTHDPNKFGKAYLVQQLEFVK